MSVRVFCGFVSLFFRKIRPKIARFINAKIHVEDEDEVDSELGYKIFVALSPQSQ